MKSLAQDMAQSFHSITGILGLAKPSCPFPTAGVHIPPDETWETYTSMALHI